MVFERADSPELWDFLNSLLPGVVLSGVVAAVEPFGVFVDLDDGPPHPRFPGVGFITLPELAWQRFDTATDIVQTGQRVTCEFMVFDRGNLEARLSLRALQPDPFRVFLDAAFPGLEVAGQVTKVVPFGFFVRVADGVEGLVPQADPAAEVGDEVMVVVADLDRGRRRLGLRVC